MGMPFCSYEFKNEVYTVFSNVVSQLIIDVEEPQKFLDVTHRDTHTRCHVRPPSTSASTLRFALGHETLHRMLMCSSKVDFAAG